MTNERPADVGLFSFGLGALTTVVAVIGSWSVGFVPDGYLTAVPLAAGIAVWATVTGWTGGH